MRKHDISGFQVIGKAKVVLGMVFFFSLMITSCVRNTIEDTIPEEIKGLTVPADFDWSSVSSTQLTVIPSDTYQGNYYYLIEVFDANPVLDTAAILLAQGVATQDQYFVTDITLASAVERVFVRQSDPLKLQTIQSVAIDSGSVMCDFSLIQPISNLSKKRNGIVMRTAYQVQENETPVNAIRLTSNLSNNLTLVANTAYLIPAGITYTGKLSFSSGSSLYVEGALNVTENAMPSLSNNTKLVVQPGGTLIAGSNSTFHAYAGAIINYGTLTVDNVTLNNTSTVYNKGTFTVNDLLSTSDHDNVVVNEGTMSLGRVNLTNGSVNNSGSMTVDGTLTANGAEVTNSGQFVVQDISTVNTKWYVNCGLYVNGTLTDQSGSTFYLKEGTILKADGLSGSGTKIYMEASSMLDVQTVVFNGQSSNITGTGNSYALARLGSVSAGNGSYKCIYYSGRVEIECSDHYQGNQWNPFYVIDNNVRWAEAGKATTQIVSGNCNTEGNVVVPPETIPSNPVFPIDVPASSVYTFIMEDNWPALADYDMNDLVLNFSIKYKQNNKNKVTSMTVNYLLRAVGAKKNLAAAFQLDEIIPSQIKRINYGNASMLTGIVFPRDTKGYESGQTKVVIPFFDNAHRVLNPGSTTNIMLNTFNEPPYFNAVSNSVTVEFENPVNPSSIGIMKLNIFIVAQDNLVTTNRTEIHLSGFAPTDKADQTRFGKYYDNSVNGSWYTTPGNLVWGLLIPTNFSYASERKSILDVYPEFVGWCTSGGLNNKNWYQHPTSEPDFLFND